MYGRGELQVVHAVGLPYRERSHFDAQNVLESGGSRPFELTTGWLGRALGAGAGQGHRAGHHRAAGAARPGRRSTPGRRRPCPTRRPIWSTRLERLYGSDPALAGALARAKALHFDAAHDGRDEHGRPTRWPAARGRAASCRWRARAAEFLSQPSGPRAAVLELGGWDSHANEAAPQGATANALRTLDAGLAALREGLAAGGVWRDTVVVVATEFGREVAVNGTQGTDHGTAARPSCSAAR